MSTSFYDIISDGYDELQKGFDAKLWAENISALIDKYHKTASSIVDLGCGTGSITSILSNEMGYKCIGVDRSRGMLNIAMKKDNCSLYEEADIRDYCPKTSVDVAISTLDTINHLIVPSDIHKLFSKIYSYLIPGGLFIFDVGSRKHFEKTLGDNVFYEDYDEYTLLWLNAYDKEERLSTSEISLFERLQGNTYRREDISVHERLYDKDFILSSIEKAGFLLVEDVIIDEGERILYVLKKDKNNG